MRDSFSRLLWRCLVWALAPTFSSAEWVYSGLGTAVTATVFEACRRYWEVELIFPNQSIQTVLTFIFVCLLVFLIRLLLSPFYVWRQDIREFRKYAEDMSNKNRILSQQVDRLSLNAPKLIAEFNEIGGGGFFSSRPNDMPLIIVITIKNIGNYPTIVDNYTVQVMHNGRQVAAEMEHPSSPIVIEAQPGSELKEKTFFLNDVIYMKTSHPIQIGAMARGFIYVNLNGFNRENFTNIYITVKFKDIFGVEYSVSETPKGKKDGASFLPQMESKVIFK